MKRVYIPEGKFNTKLALGFEWDDSIPEDAGLTLALIVSESLNSISDPVLVELEKQLQIPNDQRITLADYGSLVYASCTKKNGSHIFLGLPSWCQGHKQAIHDLLSLILVGSFRNYIKEFDRTARWLAPIKIFDISDLAPKFHSVKFNPTWMLISAIEKLRRIQFDMQGVAKGRFRPSTIKAISRLVQAASLFSERQPDTFLRTNK